MNKVMPNCCGIPPAINQRHDYLWREVCISLRTICAKGDDATSVRRRERQGKSTKKKEKKKKSTIKPPVEVFETVCFKFMQGPAMDAFMKSLPSDFGQDRLFCVLITQSLRRLVRQWVADGMKMAPPDVMPKVPGMKSIVANRNSQVVVSVDTNSEVHHFVASAINVYKRKARKRFSPRL